jgi:hypothetical protein
MKGKTMEQKYKITFGQDLEVDTMIVTGIKELKKWHRYFIDDGAWLIHMEKVVDNV